MAMTFLQDEKDTIQLIKHLILFPPFIELFLLEIENTIFFYECFLLGDLISGWEK